MPQPLAHDPIAAAYDQWAAHGWGEYAEGMAAITSVMRAQQIFLARVEAVLKPLELTFARYELLALLSFTKTGSMPMAKASARLQVHPTSVTNAVDRLEAAGLVERSPHPTDRRTTLVGITDAGRRLVETATEQLNDSVFAAPGVRSEDLRPLLRILASVRSDAGDFADPPSW